MLELFPQLADVRIDYAWGGTLSVTVKRFPQLGRLEPNVFFAHGYSGHGVSIANLSGKIIAEAIMGTAERFDVMASIKALPFPGGTLLRYPGMVLGMFYYSLKDRL
jgi:gamma-glutamylputrescine oxidase